MASQLISPVKKIKFYSFPSKFIIIGFVTNCLPVDSNLGFVCQITRINKINIPTYKINFLLTSSAKFLSCNHFCHAWLKWKYWVSFQVLLFVLITEVKNIINDDSTFIHLDLSQSCLWMYYPRINPTFWIWFHH